MTSVPPYRGDRVPASARVVGAVLAGGRGVRLGGAKATVELAGRPLAVHAVEVLRRVASEVVVVAKAGTPLPALDVPVWRDDDAADHHPRHGLVRALRGAGGVPVLALAVDLPLVTPAFLRALTDVGSTAVAAEDGRLQPLCAVYAPAVLDDLLQAPPGEPLTATVRRLRPVVVDAPPGVLLNVNRPEDLVTAASRLGTSGT